MALGFKFGIVLGLIWLLAIWQWLGTIWEAAVTQVVKALDGRRLSVDSVGDPDGTPVFLLHGTPGGRHGPRPRGIVLYRLGIRLISYDRPGFPGSDRSEGRSVGDAADDVEAIADSFGIDQFSVVGRSGGGPHALACAARLKDRVRCAAVLGSLAPYVPYTAEGLDWSLGMAESNVRTYQIARELAEAIAARRVLEVEEPIDAARAEEIEKRLDILAQRIEERRRILTAILNAQAEQTRGNSQGLLRFLWPELDGHDKEVIGDIALRRIIAKVHTTALSENVDGWMDDVIALSSDWGFELSDICAPVKLWSGNDDVFSPTAHTSWLEKHIPYAYPDIDPGAAHFGAVEILPRILSWVAQPNITQPA